MCCDSERSFRLHGIGCRIRPPPEITRKRNLFHPSMDTRLLKSLKGRGLSERKTRLRATFGEKPAPMTVECAMHPLLPRAKLGSRLAGILLHTCAQGRVLEKVVCISSA